MLRHQSFKITPQGTTDQTHAIQNMHALMKPNDLQALARFLKPLVGFFKRHAVVLMVARDEKNRHWPRRQIAPW